MSGISNKSYYYKWTGFMTKKINLYISFLIIMIHSLSIAQNIDCNDRETKRILEDYLKKVCHTSKGFIINSNNGCVALANTIGNFRDKIKDSNYVDFFKEVHSVFLQKGDCEILRRMKKITDDNGSNPDKFSKFENTVLTHLQSMNNNLLEIKNKKQNIINPKNSIDSLLVEKEHEFLNNCVAFFRNEFLDIFNNDSKNIKFDSKLQLDTVHIKTHKVDFPVPVPGKSELTSVQLSFGVFATNTTFNRKYFLYGPGFKIHKMFGDSDIGIDVNIFALGDILEKGRSLAGGIANFGIVLNLKKLDLCVPISKLIYSSDFIFAKYYNECSDGIDRFIYSWSDKKIELGFEKNVFGSISDSVCIDYSIFLNYSILNRDLTKKKDPSKKYEVKNINLGIDFDLFKDRNYSIRGEYTLISAEGSKRFVNLYFLYKHNF